MVPRTRVIVVDDHDLVREGLKRIVQAQEDMVLVGEVASAASALASVRSTETDIVLMDVSLPDSDGVSLTGKLLRERPSVRIIGVSRHNEPGVVDAMIQAGAAGYVLKQNASSQLPEAIRSVARGDQYVNVPSGVGMHRGPMSGDETWEEASHPPLTSQEEDVLRLMAFSHTHEQIGRRLGITIDETMQLKASGMQKAHLLSRVDVIAYARARGWLSKPSRRVSVHNATDNDDSRGHATGPAASPPKTTD